MIQLLHLRSFVKDGAEKKFDSFIRDGWHADSVIDLFENWEKFAAEIPEKERWNCFYTLANCSNKKREFQSLSVMYFDIDGIDKTQLDAYVQTVCAALNIDAAKVGTVSSGNGLHIIIGLMTPIVDKNYFRDHKDHYKAICTNLDRALTRVSLPGKADPSVFDPRRIFRMPGTVNRKPGKPESVCTVLNRTIVPMDFDITLASGVPKVRQDEQIAESELKRFPKVDNEAIFKGCSFLRQARERPQDLSEPQWYAALSITSRMENGHKVSHTISQGHPAYSEEDTNLKIEQAQNASGPRKCSSIAQIWGGCTSCPHFKTKSSPILLVSPDAIKTEHTGFHDLIFDPETNKLKVGKPNYIDLRKFFERKHTFRTHNKVVWVWTGTHYKEMTPDHLEAFALKHFSPYANGLMRSEFRDLIQKSNLVDQDIWNRGTVRKINFQNGVLDLATMQMAPHSTEFGFKYVLPYAYDPTARAPRFEQFLQEVCQGKETLVNSLLEFGGYALAGADCRYEKALLLSGEGSNGKSTLIKVLQHVAGNGSYSTLSFKELENMERRASLDGALFNVTEETPNKVYDTSAFKALITGATIHIRRLYREAYPLENKAKLIFACNELPMSMDSSKGFLRRFLIIPFDAHFTGENRDRSLLDKLKEELPGILNLFLEGMKRLDHQGGFSKVEETDADIGQYQQAIDPLAMWTERLQVVALPSEHFSTTAALFADFKVWAEANGYKKQLETLNLASLGMRMRRYIPDIAARRRQVGTNRERRIYGISLPPSDF